MLDIEGGDVIGHQHDFVGKKLVGIEAPDILFCNTSEQIDHKISSSGTWVKDVNVWIAERLAKMGLQSMDNACGHEVHDRLRRINNSMCVGESRGIAAEELLINGVKEVLLITEVRQRSRGILDCNVKTV